MTARDPFTLLPPDVREIRHFHLFGAIGNAVPPAAAEAIAGVMGTTLLLAWSGETFMLSSQPIWVRPVAVALTVAQGGVEFSRGVDLG